MPAGFSLFIIYDLQLPAFLIQYMLYILVHRGMLHKPALLTC